MAAVPLSDLKCIETLEIYARHGNQIHGAAEAGVSRTTFQSRLIEARRRIGVRDTPLPEPLEPSLLLPGTEPKPRAVGYRSHLVIPDTQVKPGVPLDHMTWIGKYAADKNPDVIVCLGDFADMPSLSSYDRGKKQFEGRRYKADVEAVHQAMELLMTPLVDAGYKGRLVLTLGNHENRINRAVEDDSKLDGTIGVEDLGYEAWGWEVIPFLKVVEIDGLSYSHYFYNPMSGRPYAGTCITKLKNIGMSFVMGHQQGIDIAMRDLANGKKQHGLVCGSAYLHDEDYKGPQGNGHYQGLVMLNEVRDGSYDLMQVSLDFLRRKYGSTS